MIADRGESCDLCAMLKAVPDPVPGETRSTVPTDAEIEKWALAYLRHAPISLALREINRLVAFQSVAGGRGPVLDVGCGDGFWWTVRADGRDIYGIDISAREIAQAKQHIHAELVDVSAETPFRGTKFEEIIGNCSLEHVPDIDGALSNLRASAAPDARLLMFVPTPRWAYQGRIQSLLLRVAPRLAMTMSGALNGFFQHWHLYDQKVWTRLLEQNGWKVKATFGLGSKRSEFLFRMFMPPSFVEFIAKQLTGTYPSRLARYLPDRAIAPFARLVRWAVSDPLVSAESPHAYEYLIIADAAEVPSR
jgi:SAM-dependent methyltransferase